MDRSIWRAKKIFADIIHNMTTLEGNPFTVPEIQTLLDGITVGGHKISDAEQVIKQKNSFLLLFDMVKSGRFSVTPEVALELQRVGTKSEASEKGGFRNAAVGIAGTDYRPPAGSKAELPQLLKEQFRTMATKAARLQNPYEKGMVAFLHVARSRCFWDGNQRTGHLLMNGTLLAAGQDIITISTVRQLDFSQKMMRFYNSGDGTEMMNFLSGLQIRAKFE